MKRLKIILALVVPLGALIYFSLTEVHRRSGLNRLRGSLSRVEIQFDCWGVVTPPPTSPWQGKRVGSEDPVFLARVEAWLEGLQRPACENALRQRGGRIVLTFWDGRQEELLFRGADRPGPTATPCGGFSWEGLGVVGGEEPFTDFLRALGPE
jgi:hypothetical protein